MHIKSFLVNWIEIGNSYDIQKYLDQYQDDAVLHDPSVGKKFIGHKGIGQYFTNYFINWILRPILYHFFQCIVYQCFSPKFTSYEQAD